MQKLEKRIARLERDSGIIDQHHVVIWGWGQSFDDAMKRSFKPQVKHGRMLIELTPYKGGHGEPVVPAWEPEYQEEYDKAHAWADG